VLFGVNIFLFIISIGNNYCFEDIFSRKFDALACDGDLLIAISTSGNSKKIIKVIKKSSSQRNYSIVFNRKKGVFL